MPPVTQLLPYLGPHKENSQGQQRAKWLEIPASYLQNYELDQQRDRLSPDPMDILIAKVAHLAELLNCSEEQAERILFKRIGGSTKPFNRPMR